MRHVVVALMLLSLPLYAAEPDGEDAFRRFEQVVAGIRRSADDLCADRLTRILKDEAPAETETFSNEAQEILPLPELQAPATAADPQAKGWRETALRVEDRMRDASFNAPFTIRDQDGRLTVPQWEYLFEALNLRVLGLRSHFDEDRVEALVEKAERGRPSGVQLVDFTRPPEPSRLGTLLYKNDRTKEVREVLARREGRLTLIPYVKAKRGLRVYLRPETSRLPIPQALADVTGAGRMPQAIQIFGEPGANLERKALRLMRAMVTGHMHLFARKSRTFFFPSADSIFNGSPGLFVKLKESSPVEFFDWTSTEADPLFERLQWSYPGDGEFETHLYLLYLQTRTPLPPWTGRAFELRDHDVDQTPALAPLKPPKARAWSRKRWWIPQDARRWSVGVMDYRVIGMGGSEKARVQTEAGVLRGKSPISLAFLPVKKVNGRIYVGLALQGSPGAQAAGESSLQYAIPSQRLRGDEPDLKSAVEDFRGLFESRFGLSLNSVGDLGGGFQIDPGIAVETVFPFVAEVHSDGRDTPLLRWFPLETLVARNDLLLDERLLLSVLRFAHAEGYLN